MLKKIYSFFFLLFFHIFLLPHVILYFISKNKDVIDQDIEAFKKRRNLNYGKSLSLVCYLKFNKYYRNIFYDRIGLGGRFLKFYFPGDKTFITPCKNIGGGINPAHPFATILNAKSIGKNFSIKQCTTIGNKNEGENDMIPCIGDNVFIGANSVLIGNITIGDNAVIGAGSVVVKDVPANCTVVGNPARIIRRNATT